MIMEVWKTIPGYEGRYEVSSLGNIKSINFAGHGKNRILKKCLNADGYEVTTLSKDGVPKFTLVHRLVAQVFVPNPNNLPFINHINENRSDNRAENLEWCTASYNANFGSRNRRMAISLGKRVEQYTIGGKLVNTYYSASEAARVLGLNPSAIAECCRGGRRKSVGGFIWRYPNQTTSTL